MVATVPASGIPSARYTYAGPSDTLRRAGCSGGDADMSGLLNISDVTGSGSGSTGSGHHHRRHRHHDGQHGDQGDYGDQGCRRRTKRERGQGNGRGSCD